MQLGWLLERFSRYAQHDAFVWNEQVFSYEDLLIATENATRFIADREVEPGTAVMLCADFSPSAVGLLLAAASKGHVVVPVAANTVTDRDKLAQIAQCGVRIDVDDADGYELFRLSHRVDHPLLLELTEKHRAGLVLFSSGSTGEPKATLHDLEMLLGRFQAERHTQRIISFLLFDHIGGFNTLMYALSNHGCVVTVAARDPDTVCRAIERHRVEVLPTSPTFLNLLLMSGAIDRYDLSSLRLIDYATEVMSQATLDRLNQALPGVALHQSYGLSEVGIMRTKSRDGRSVWLSIGGDTQTRVVDGILQIKTPTTMLGYLNAPSPFTADGWFNTQDEVEVEGNWLRVKGRNTDIINVGGEKVYPAEVESVILEVDNIADVTVTGEAHPLIGQVVVAEITTLNHEDIKKAIGRVRSHCFKRLPTFKVPVKIRRAESNRVTERFKKQRKAVLGPEGASG